MFNRSVSDVDNIILSYLEPQDLGRIAQVSKMWQIPASSNEIWKNFFPNIKLQNGLTFKQHFNEKGFVSLNELIKRIEIFKAEIPLNGNGEFRCHFPKNCNCYISIKIRHDKCSTISMRSIKIFYWFMQPPPQGRSVKDMMTVSKDNAYTFHMKLPSNPYYKHLAEKIYCLMMGEKELSLKEKPFQY